MNPLLSEDLQFPFDRIEPGHMVPAVREAIARAEEEVAAIVADRDRTFDSTIVRLDRAIARVESVSGIVEHLVNVDSTPEVRAAHARAQPLYEAFFARLETDPGVWQSLREYEKTRDASELEEDRRYFLDRAIREYRHAGADLASDSRTRAADLRVRLSELGTRFQDQVLDSLNEFSLHIVDETDLAGLPASSLDLARTEAERRGVEGWVFTLHAPSYFPFLRHSERRELRRRMHEAFTTVAAEAPHDNRPLIVEILRLRRELAELLGRDSYADYALELNMVGSARRAEEFVELLTERSRPAFERETEALVRHGATLGIDRIEPWDVHFLAERLRRERYAIDEEALRPYFPLERVLEGLFEVANRLFGVHIEERATHSIWHPEVRYFELRDDSGVHRASFYLDLHPRPTKRGGAWKASLVTGGPTPKAFRPHLLTVCANFTPPAHGRQPLLTHGEVETLFHEFGHLLHGALSQVELRTRSGTRVPRDFVELPSQIMENWCWEPEALPLFSRHVDSGEAIPTETVQRLRASRDFRAASAQMRQLGFGATDLDLHRHATDDPLARAQLVLGRYAIRPDFARDAFLCSFSHIFGGGYAASYHSYKWSEMLDADAFNRFRTEGLFNRGVGEAFASAILRRGLSAEPSRLWRDFMGRDPDIAPLLERTVGSTA